MRSLSKKTTILAIAIIVMTVLLSAAAIYMLAGKKNNSHQANTTALRYEEALRMPALSDCHIEDVAPNMGDESRQMIEYTAMTHLMNVPAGTDVDVQLVSFVDGRITGSSHYPKKYGSYNFVLTKQKANWTVSEYKRCN